MTALRVADYLQKSNNRDLDSFEKFPQSHLALAVQKKHDLSSSPFADIIDFYRQHLRDGRLLVRYSGTESILRIMTEAPSASCAEQIAHEVAQALIHYLI